MLDSHLRLDRRIEIEAGLNREFGLVAESETETEFVGRTAVIVAGCWVWLAGRCCAGTGR